MFENNTSYLSVIYFISIVFIISWFYFIKKNVSNIKKAQMCNLSSLVKYYVKNSDETQTK